MDGRAADSPSCWRGDLAGLAVLLLLAVAFRGWIVTHTEVAARDGIGFIRYALHLENPPEAQTRLDVVRHQEQPPGYPLAVLAVSLPVRHYLGTTCDSLVLSAQLASLAAGALLVVPMFYLGKELFGRWVGFAAAGLFQCLPGPAAITTDALSEATFLLVLTTTLLGAVHALRKPTPLRLALCGLGGGVAYLVRPEGLLVVVAVAVTVLLAQASPALRRPWPRVAGGLAGLAAGAAVLVAPYACLIGGLTNKPTANVMLHGGKLDPTTTVAGPPLGSVFAAWWSDADGHQAKLLWGVRSLLRETAQDFQFAGAGLAVIGLICVPRRPGEAGRWLLLTLAAVHAVVLVRMAVVIGYLSERHALPLVLVGCYWAAAALPVLAGQLVRLPALGRRLTGPAVAALLLGGLLVAGVAGGLKPLHATRAGHHAAGRWLAAHMSPADVLVDPFAWAHYYSGEFFREEQEKPKPAGAQPVVFVIWEQSNNQHSRLPMIALANDIRRNARIVYSWPESRPVDQATIVVYRNPPP
jgi:4-amino-4-deoxy-L-arabinose transferase-like glycosyltransferase